MFYKGKDFYSVGLLQHKKATISSTFTRIKRNCSTKSLWEEAVAEKIMEYTTIGYPKDLVTGIAENITFDN